MEINNIHVIAYETSDYFLKTFHLTKTIGLFTNVLRMVIGLDPGRLLIGWSIPKCTHGCLYCYGNAV